MYAACAYGRQRHARGAGAIVAPAMDVEGVGRFGCYMDPVGATIGVIKPSES